MRHCTTRPAPPRRMTADDLQRHTPLMRQYLAQANTIPQNILTLLQKLP